jgi:hypothetical protein
MNPLRSLPEYEVFIYTPAPIRTTSTFLPTSNITASPRKG